MRHLLIATITMAWTLAAAQQQPAVPVITSAPARADAPTGAQIVSITDAMPNAAIYYTSDGTEPNARATPYQAPFLVASNLSIRAVAVAAGGKSATASRSFRIAVAPGTLLWSDEFATVTGTNARPDPKIWTYDTGNDGFGNHELETYCALGGTGAPCDAATPNAYVAPDGYLHIVARRIAPGTYTSARLKSQGLFSVSPGSGSIRVEARIKLPLGQGMWPAFWTLGNNVTTVEWPACGEQDIMEHIDAPSPDWIAASLHGTHGDTTQHYPTPPRKDFSAGEWHTYGMIWSKGRIAFYVDSPANIYTSVTAADFAKQPGAVWPFDSGGVYLVLNLAVGGDWPKSPDATTKFPSELLVDYVRVYANKTRE